MNKQQPGSTVRFPVSPDCGAPGGLEFACSGALKCGLQPLISGRSQAHARFPVFVFVFVEREREERGREKERDRGRERDCNREREREMSLSLWFPECPFRE